MQYLFSSVITLVLLALYIQVPMIAFGRGQSKEYIQTHKMTFVVYFLLRLLVTFTMIRSFQQENYYNAFLCLMVLVMFVVPMFIERKWKIELPSLFEIIILLFIFAAEILGEIESYYTIYLGWDTVLHTLNGFLCAAVGFSLVDMLNRQVKVPLKLSPIYLAITAFCFSMTIGVLWEFGEFAMDHFLNFDAQKDFVVTSFGTVYFDEDGYNNVMVIDDIAQTDIITKSGEVYTIENGYLDIGITDTMKDLFVNFIGAVVFCILGFLYQINEKRFTFAKRFMIRVEPIE